MSDLRKAAQQALEALEAIYGNSCDAIHALRAALAQQPEPAQEPVAWRYQDARGNYRYRGYVQGFDKEYSRLKPVPLYAAPPQRPPLTDEEIAEATAQERDALLDHIYEYGTAAEGVLERIRKLCRAVERRVREKRND